jgi:hypothetical protein
MYVWVNKGFTLTWNSDWGFPLCTTFPKILTFSVSKKGTPPMLPFSLEESQQANPLQVPQWGPYGEKYLLTGHFYLSLNISVFIFPSESPVREPPPCSLTGSPWTAILRHQSHWSAFHSFIPVCLPESPNRIPYEEKHRLPYTEPNTDGRPTFSGVWPGSPRNC